MSDQERVETTAEEVKSGTLLPGRMFTGECQGRQGYKLISARTHGQMHQALALAARDGYGSICCEVCSEQSGSVGPTDTRELERILQAMADMVVPDDDPAELPVFGERPVQPHRRHLYPDLPGGWDRMTFKTLDIDEANRNVVTAAQSWVEMRSGVLVLLGPTGVGKTHLLSALTQELLQKSADISAWEFDHWHGTLRGVFDSGRDEIDAFEHRMLRCGFWVVDDIRAEHISQGVREMFERVVHRRTQEGRPIMLTTNATEEEWATWSARAYSRLRARAYATWLPMVDRDRRLVP